MYKRILIAVPVIAGLLAVPVLRAGWPVTDFIGNGYLFDQITKMKEQINWMRQQYEVQTDTYMQIYRNAQYLMNKNRWTAAIRSWTYPVYGSRSGKTAPWAAATKDGTRAAEAWTETAAGLPDIISAHGTLGNRRSRKSSAATSRLPRSPMAMV